MQRWCLINTMVVSHRQYTASSNKESHMISNLIYSGSTMRRAATKASVHVPAKVDFFQSVAFFGPVRSAFAYSWSSRLAFPGVQHIAPKNIFLNVQFLRKTWIYRIVKQFSKRGGKEKQKVTTNRFTRRSINIDADNFARCQTLANDLAISISGLIRLLIKQAYEKHMKSLKQDNQSVLTQQ
jgi:hypothetical protein